MAIDVPPEIIVDIFSKLPVKSLCRFKCLSKAWLLLISNTKFAKMHLSRTNTQKFLNYHSSSRSLYSVDYETSYQEDEVVAVKLGFPKKNKRRSRWVSIYGSCNGLILLRCQPKPYATYIYNPSINEYRQIPDEDDPGNLTITHYNCFYGFGYAQPVDDYKVVKFCTREKNTVRVFSLRNNSWKRVELEYDISKFYDTDNRGGIFLNGAIHWIFYDEGESKLVAFDLMEENFKTLPLPEGITSMCSSVGILGGCLVFIERRRWGNYLWIMKEYNVIDSWEAISMMDEDNYQFECLQALCYLKINSEIMVGLENEKLVFYNPRDETLKELASRKISYNFPYCPDVYQESLVSPNYNANSTDEGINGYSLFILHKIEELKI
ncbi:putative F-box family protein [Melia azedarach]|uniref:F-box family protein n=1 Tax=Melia azedarach TaxID=155640 RepID=A0ACC1WYY7_MELAZ|nr:putative F-box family protein [Melia azedarach]